MHYLLWVGFVVWLLWGIGQKQLLPWLNRNIYSRIWSEEPRPVVTREAIERIKELCVTGDVPEDTAILIAAKEYNVSEHEFLAAFDANDAAELVMTLISKKPNLGTVLLKKLARADRLNMRRL